MTMPDDGAADPVPDEAPPGPSQLSLASLDAPDAHEPTASLETLALGADEAIPRGCPFLLAETGGWRLDVPTRDHRCAAVSPPAPLSIDKQSRLCLTDAHTTCATYLASMSARGSRIGAQAAAHPSRWGLTRTTTVIEDVGGFRSRVSGLVLDRGRWPAIPAVLLVVTLLVLAVSGLRGGTTPVATESPTRPVATATPSRSAGPTTAPTTTPEPEPSPTPSSAPTPSPSSAPSTPTPSFRTYRVKSGDTLSAIAATYGTTSRAIADLNGISVSSTLRVGQVLKIPNT